MLTPIDYDFRKLLPDPATQPRSWRQVQKRFATEGLRICSDCKQVFPNTREYFHVRGGRDNTRPNGERRLHARCRDCRAPLEWARQQRRLDAEAETGA